MTRSPDHQTPDSRVSSEGERPADREAAGRGAGEFVEATLKSTRASVSRTTFNVHVTIWPTDPSQWALAFLMVAMVCLAVSR